jgi:hypothetical protein
MVDNQRSAWEDLQAQLDQAKSKIMLSTIQLKLKTILVHNYCGA